jgi:UDP-N-acetyl-D-mannosaminuronic acid dehydrogenase
MVVSIIGLGYIGLPTAAILASNNIKVLGIDNNENTVSLINKGQIHIVEPNLDTLVKKVVSNGNLKAFVKPIPADVFMIAVPTPFKNKNEPDLSYIESAVKDISNVVKEGNMIILESTVPVGTTEKIKKWLLAERPELTFPENNHEITNGDINIAHCPERVLPGDVLNELVNNDRIIGGLSTFCANRAKIFYQDFVKGECITTDCRTAELSKLVENSYRDVNIAFANELSLISDKLDINVWELIKLANLHPRVNILKPGPGVGGHCIAVDPWFIVDSAPEESKLISTARLINDFKPEFVCKKIEQAASKTLKINSELKILSLGLSFKPNIDDLRESPAMTIAKQIESMGFKNSYICEPNIKELPKLFNENKSELIMLNQVINDVDIVVVLVDHDEFKNLDLSFFDGKQVVDTRGILEVQ